MTAKTDKSSFLVGIPLVLAGSFVRLWSAGYLRKLSMLITAGPFAICRNPLYIGSFFILCGYLVMCNRLDVALTGGILFWLFHGGAVAFEERLLRDRFGDEFCRYCSKVPRFLPKIGKLSGYGEFSFRQIRNNDELISLAGTALITVIFAYRAFIH